MTQAMGINLKKENGSYVTPVEKLTKFFDLIKKCSLHIHHVQQQAYENNHGGHQLGKKWLKRT